MVSSPTPQTFSKAPTTLGSVFARWPIRKTQLRQLGQESYYQFVAALAPGINEPLAYYDLQNRSETSLLVRGLIRSRPWAVDRALDLMVPLRGWLGQKSKKLTAATLGELILQTITETADTALRVVGGRQAPPIGHKYRMGTLQQLLEPEKDPVCERLRFRLGSAVDQNTKHLPASNRAFLGLKASLVHLVSAHFEYVPTEVQSRANISAPEH